MSATQAFKLKKLFPFSVIFGLMPCDSDVVENFNIAVYSLTLQLTYRILAAASVYILDLAIPAGSFQPKSLLIPLTLAVAKASSPLIHIATVILRRNKFIELQKVKFSPPVFKNKYRYMTFAGFIAFPIPLVVRIQPIKEQSVLHIVCSIVDATNAFIIAMQFCTLLNYAVEYITHLESKLKAMRILKIKPYQSSNQLETIIEEHSRAMDFCHSVNCLYSKQLFCIIYYLSYDFIIALYDTINSFFLHRGLRWCLCTILYSLMCLSTVFSICDISQRTKNKADQFYFELFRLIKDNRELCKNEKLYLYLSVKSTVSFTACGFFTLGYPLIRSIIAAATTYLVILLQFSSPNDCQLMEEQGTK